MQESKYLELRISARAMDEEAFGDFCAQYQAQGQASEIAADSGQETHVAWFTVKDDDLTPALARALTHLGLSSEDFTMQLLEARDWSTAWQEYWHAMPIGDRLWVRPSFREPAPEGRIDIVLDSGMAFGIGTHPSTRLCLQAIESLCTDTPPDRVLDMGAGSGILAIAALKLGARHADAIDVSPEAVTACRTNAKANGVQLNAWQHDTPPAGRYDLVLANILARPLIAMSEALARCTDQYLVLAGLLTRQMDEVRTAYMRHGLVCAAEWQDNEWGALLFHRSR